MKLCIHGGTSAFPQPDEIEKREAMSQAFAVGLTHLENGDSAVDAVVASVQLLEESGLFYAGMGSEPQRDGVIRYDASIMSSDGRAGAVIGVSEIASAVSGATLILRHPHILHTTLVGPPADEILLTLGAKPGPPSNPGAKKVASQYLKEYFEEGGQVFGTVGATALDHKGLLAAATSTGSFQKALPGRTGDSGVIGIGTLASSRCAISCTGDGDKIVRLGLATAIDTYLESGLSPSDAVQLARRRLDSIEALGGFILLLPNGDCLCETNLPVFRHLSSPA